MNLNTCTPGQRASVECVDRPLLVSAGAGSGKTFTLTQRIAYALLPESGPAAASIDEVLAITFTEKAAAEIKARVKRTLRAEGLGEEALKVDGSWISTIHGMCSRILRTHALDLNLDPAFDIVGDAQRKDLIAAAIDSALGEDNDVISHGSYATLFNEYPARSSGFNDTSIAGMLQNIMDKASNLRGGLDAIDFGPAPACASTLARELLMAYEGVMPALEQAGKSAAAEKARAGAADALDALQAFLTDSTKADEVPALAAVVNECMFLGKNFGGAEVKEAVAAYQEVHARIAQHILIALARPQAVELMTLAREVSRRYEDAKRAIGKLDNDDLLIKTLEAFETCPDIASRYEKRFKLVMVDEFQDTSQLQIDMIAHLAGPNFAHLCTVGDAQQSIYRFRGADVNVYEEHKRTMKSQVVGALYIELTKNFRSHGDVLSFVDRVFEQPHVFGDSFMSLEPHETRPSCYKGSAPRIDLVVAQRPSGRGTGVSTEDAKRVAARELARRFAAFRADGHAPGDMVVLLGAMTRADVYAEALREQGFECVIAGGSLFSSAPEVHVVARLLEAVANPANTAALFEVLTSGMVCLSADDFLELTTEVDAETGCMRRRNLDRGFARLADQVDVLPPRLAHAVRLFDSARREARTQSASVVVRNAVVRSGWMARLEREGAVGMAVVANVLKAIRLIESVETACNGGFASTAQAFARELEALKEAPGALSGTGSSVVKIMTIHASKGLEFPLVGLAEFAGSGRNSKLVMEACGSKGWASLVAGRSADRYPALKNRAKDTPAPTPDDDGYDTQVACAAQFIAGETNDPGACSSDAYRAALKRRAVDEELSEARRKLYVGLTRASEALVVVMDVKASSKDITYPDLIDDMRSALCGIEDFPSGVAELPYGGSMPARFERVVVQPGEEEVPLQEVQNRFTVPVMSEAKASRIPWSAQRADVFSYSSIASSVPDEEEVSCPKEVETCSSIADVNFLSALEGDAPLALPRIESFRLDGTGGATGFGSAFHRAAQFAVETGGEPSASRLDALSSTFGLSSEQRLRLSDACARWFASTTYVETTAWSLRRAEVPFFVRIGAEFMEGEIDLLCTDGPQVDGGHALVIDYKTGGRGDESAELLYKKHALQAQCYAYALLVQGCAVVELRFVRIEREDADGGPQVVRYRFVAGDEEELACIIQKARNR